MKAVGYKKSLSINDIDSLIDIELPMPSASGRDLLVKIHSIAANPVDCKIRQKVSPEDGEHRVLGWDAVGEVVAVGDQVRHYEIGDLVYYAGDLNRQGCNAEYQLVDEQIVGSKPDSLSNADAAALPLTAITAWELLFDHLLLKKKSPDSDQKSNEVLLVVGAAGGVGSILLQLAKTLSGATLIATASRESSKAWVEELGADFVIDHSHPLKPQIDALNLSGVTHVASLNSTQSYFESYVDILLPFGKIGLIDDPQNLDVSIIKPKSLSLHWEFMFARSMFASTDIGEQRALLNRVSKLVDQGYIRTTAGKHLGAINAVNLRAAHKELESRRSIGKIVLEGFG